MTGVSLVVLTMLAQNFEQRGFIENRALVYPQTAPNDGGYLVNETLLRWDASVKTGSWFKLNGSFQARTDSHRQTEREWRGDADERFIQLPAHSVRHVSGTLH